MRFPRVLLLAFLVFPPSMVWVLDAGCSTADGSIQSPESKGQYLEYLFELSKELDDHKGAVGSVVFSPDGRLIASGSADSTVKLWDADSGKPIKAIMRHPSPIMCVVFSPDSNVLAAGSEAGTISLWDVNYRERIRTLKGHKDRVWSVRFSPDGKLLASGSMDNTIRLWDMGSGKEVKTLNGHTNSVHSLSFSPTDKILASGSADGTVRIWDLDTWKSILTLKENGDAVNSICFSPDGKTLASGTRNGNITLWDVSSGKEVGAFEDGHKSAIGVNDCLSFSPDGRALSSGSSDTRILVWNLSSGNMISEVKAHTSIVNSIAFRPDGRSMASAGLDGVVKLWKIRVKESLEVAFADAEYGEWQRGILGLKADILGLPDMVKFQYSLDGSTWLDIAEKGKPPYEVDWNTTSSVPGASKGVRLRVVAETPTGVTAMDMADGSFAVDNEPPNTEHDYDGLWHRANFSINLSADDGNGIGLSDTMHKLNYGQEKIVRWSGQPEITEEGTNTLEYWSVDKLGNEEPHKVLSDIKLDKTGPTFLAWTKEPENLAEGIVERFRVSVQLMDEGGSGLAGKSPQFDYHIGTDTAYDGYEDMSGGDGNVWYYEMPEPSEGWRHYRGEPIYYKVRCEDVAGNVGRSAEQQDLLGSKEVPPTVKMTNDLRNWESGLLVIKAEASDTDGVIKDVQFEYSLDNVSWTLIGASTAPPYSIEWDTPVDIAEVSRTVWVRITSTDNDGLSAKYVSPMFGIDSQPPITSHDYDGLWHKMDITVNLTADDGHGSGISRTKYRLKGGPERDVLTDGQPKISEQGKNALEYWSVDVAGNEEVHKVLSEVKVDRLAPFFEKWHVQREGNIVHVEVNVTDADSGLEAAPQLDHHIGLNTRYSGYGEMERIDGNRWKYDIDISSNMPDALGETMFFKVNAKDAVGNLGIRMWEYEITGEIDTAPSIVSKPTPTEPPPKEDLDIKPVDVAPAVESKKRKSSVVWSTRTSGPVKVNQEVVIQGTLEPEMSKSVPLDVTMIAPNGNLYVSRIDTDLSGAFQFSVPLTSQGEWKIFVDWKGDDEYEPVKSKALTFRVISEDAKPSDPGRTARKAGSFLKKNTMIIGLLFLYVVIIRLYKG